MQQVYTLEFWLLIFLHFLRSLTYMQLALPNNFSAQPTENILTAPSAKEMNNTSLIASTDNTINNNPPSTTSTQNNDTSNSKKSSEKSITISQPKSKDQLAPTALTNDNTTHEKASSVTQDKNIIDTKHMKHLKTS